MSKWKIALLVGLVTSCITPVDLDKEAPEEFNLIVEGYITTNPGPHTIFLSESAQYGSLDFGVTRPVENATVVIRDDSGIPVYVDDTGLGIYRTTSDFKAEVGKSYSLIIETEIGERYISIPQEVLPAPKIENVSLKYRELPGLSDITFISGVEVNVTFTDDANQQNFYLWTQTDGVYPFVSYPELHPGLPEPCPPIDFAKNCFRYERDFEDRNYTYSEVPECIVISPKFFKYSILNDALRDGNRITHNVLFIEDDGRRFEFRYRFILHQIALNKEAYGFYSMLQSQQSITGDLFDPPPAEIRGNIINQTDPSKVAIGFFGAHGVDTTEVYVPAAVLERKQPKIKFFRDCWTLDSSTVRRPEWWKDQ